MRSGVRFPAGITAYALHCIIRVPKIAEAHAYPNGGNDVNIISGCSADGSAPDLGSGGRGFEPRYSDQCCGSSFGRASPWYGEGTEFDPQAQLHFMLPWSNWLRRRPFTPEIVGFESHWEYHTSMTSTSTSFVLRQPISNTRSLEVICRCAGMADRLA